MFLLLDLKTAEGEADNGGRGRVSKYGRETARRWAISQIDASSWTSNSVGIARSKVIWELPPFLNILHASRIPTSPS